MGDAGALKRKLRAARSAAGIESDQDLALRAGVHLQTLQNWMYGKTTPRPSELHKVARVLGVPLDALMAAYEGRDPEPPALHESIRELVDAIGGLVDEIRKGREADQSRQRDEIATAVREAVEPLWQVVRAAAPQRGERSPGSATRGEHG